jgi:homoserine kinase
VSSPVVIARATVRVPATSSNLGAGFDCVGVALDRWLTASVELREGASDVVVSRSGTLRDLVTPVDNDPRADLLYRGFAAAAEAASAGFKGTVTFEAASTIPVARGLGSSAAALLAGAALANVVLQLELTRTDMVSLCATIEGHADNVAPAGLGGAVLIAPLPSGKARYFVLAVHDSLGFAFAVPNFETQTAAARAALPDQVPHAVAVSAAARAAALIQGLRSADPALLASAFDDVLHVPYRRAMVPHYDVVVDAARRAGAFGATLSGSGSSIVAIAPHAQAARIAAAMAEAWRVAGVPADSFATRVGSTGLVVESSSRGSAA